MPQPICQFGKCTGQRVNGMLLCAFVVLALCVSHASGKGNRYALLIGVSHYDQGDLDDLPYAEKDVTALSRVLISHCGFSEKNVYLMTRAQAAKELRFAPESKKIRDKLNKLIQIVDEQDVIVIAFAGHGIQFAKEKENYFCPADADLSDRKTLISLKTEVYKALETKCRASVKLLFVDACRNDPRTTASRARRAVNLTKLNQPQAIQVPKGLAAFFSCRAGQAAFEDKKLGHGIFFHFLLEGLRGKANNHKEEVTLSSLKEYVRTEVKNYALRELNKVQVPELIERSQDVITLVSRRRVVERRPELGGTFHRKFLRSLQDRGTSYYFLNEHAPSQLEKWKRLAEEGKPLEQLYVGATYLYGYGVKRDRSEGFRWLTKAADKKVPYAQYYLAICYLNGWGVEKDEKKAVELFSAARDQGNPDALIGLAYRYRYGQGGLEKSMSKYIDLLRQAAKNKASYAKYQLGLAYLDGNGVKQDDREAFKWFQEAAEQKNIWSENFVGWCYEKGRGVERDYKKAVLYYQKAADADYAVAINNLGLCYFRGRGVTQNKKTAFEQFLRAANFQNTSGIYHVGYCYYFGEGTNRDYDEAVKWFRKGIDKGNSSCGYYLGQCYALGRGVTKDVRAAFRSYRKAADQGHISAQYETGKAYLLSLGTDRNDQEAFKWYLKAAKNDHLEAQNQVALSYRIGRGVTKDETEAIKWYRKAVDGNHLAAAVDLGYCYSQGIGVTQNYREAVKYYRKAAEGGNSIGQCNLAICYANGFGVNKDMEEAVKWYSKSAVQGYSQAEYNIGRCYELGLGLKRDLAAARRWYGRAASKNYQFARQALDRLNGRGGAVESETGPLVRPETPPSRVPPPPSPTPGSPGSGMLGD